MALEEEGMKFEKDALFYNPQMRFCRSFGSLSVAAIGDEISVLDGFAATGIRGLRSAKENANVKKVVLLDIWRIAPGIILKNAEANGIKNAEAYNADFNEFTVKNAFDFVEIDPFGSPIHFLNNAFYSFRKMREGYVSITATDVAVLCGVNTKACLKKYGAKNLRNEFTHEIGVRVLLKKIGDFASQFDFGIEPMYTLSDRHYIKILIRIKRSAEKAAEIPRTLGYVSYCFHCGYRETGKFPNRKCANCKKDIRFFEHSKNTREVADNSPAHKKRAHTDFTMDYAGPLWLGELQDKKFLLKMRKLNAKRAYADKDELDKTLGLLIGEAGMPPFYYEMHELCRRLRCGIPKIEELIAKLRKNDFMAVRTHFCERGIKTDANLKDLKKLSGRKS